MTLRRKVKRVNVISLGCSKNLVDSERLMRMLENVGYRVVHEAEDSRKGDIVVINTCGFIGDAKEESINEILARTALRAEGKIDAVYVMGCLSERYRDVLPGEIPEVDGWYGKHSWPQLVTDLSRRHPASAPYDRVITTPRHHAYLKISEGCNRFCAFCAIPLITGRHRSRTIEEIVEEVKMLVARGVKEFNVIAQELTYYGIDLYGERRIADLIDAIAAVEGVEWIRLHYAYPADFPMEMLDAMARNPKVCRYLDIALQHISDRVLTNMRRHITADETRRLLAEIRRRVPGIKIRTTLMVGFPGEEEEDFEQLMDFVREQRFDRMGAFAYCEEEDTRAAADFTDSIPEDVKQNRLERLMTLQEEISAELMAEQKGKRLKVMIDREEPDYYVGRTEYDSPEVDPEVLVEKSVKLRPGDMPEVEIIDALPFELIARPLV
ncbi:MAG: 30S ribosomal protein S12 methylthiotransferase RimO, partial [Duncaniella sp.]|nr:30S ribosomal protein S12 methylthiotransferase RimO [Duncaniella sp.]